MESGAGINRRDFLRHTAAGMAWSLLWALEEAGGDEPKVEGPPLRCGLIGTGNQGRVLLTQAARLGLVRIEALCDVYEPYLNRALKDAPEGARTYNDYRQLLEREKDLEAVLVATPPHTHLEVCRAALEAGKHVFCEPPLAVSLEEARTLARLGREAKTVFQVGLQKRTHPLYRHVLTFIRTGVLGQPTWVRAQWQQKQSWRRVASNPQQERLLNWKLYREFSGGLLTEHGIHQFDVASWMLRSRPVAVTGFGSTLLWKDGREVPDTVGCVLEYPNGVSLLYSATLTNSFEAAYEVFYGSMGAIWVNDANGLLFKEADAPALGWEVYARKEKVGDHQGIVLDAEASKLLEQGIDPAERKQRPTYNPFYTELEAFVATIRAGKPLLCGPEEGFQATLVAWKAVESVEKRERVEIPPQLFELT